MFSVCEAERELIVVVCPAQCSTQCPHTVGHEEAEGGREAG